MTKKFNFTSDYFGLGDIPSEVTVTIFLTPLNDVECNYEIEDIFDSTCNEHREFKDFPRDEAMKINDMAEAIASENAYECMQEYLINRAEFYADAARENGE